VIEFAGDESGGAAQREYRLNAADYGLTPATTEDLAPGDGAARSAELTSQLLENAAPPSWRDLVIFNAGFRIHLAGRAPDVTGGVELAREAVASGAALGVLERWRTFA
jgi:anthranilate phosphoribosyltransferase